MAIDRQKGMKLVRRVLLGLVFTVVIWAVGLSAFIAGLPTAQEARVQPADGIVVYTGGGGARIAAGMDLLANGGGERLLISGVHPDTSRERLGKLWRGSSSLFDCCVDLGREAQSTDGNADEVSSWARVHRFKKIILVTSEYHMPRAIIATRGKLGDIVIVPHPVASGLLNERRRPVSGAAWRKLAGEYNKYMLARVKSVFSSSSG